jgi:hypothetical protein
MMMPMMVPVFKEDPSELGEGLSIVMMGKSVQV